jgi:hypothetical protein
MDGAANGIGQPPVNRQITITMPMLTMAALLVAAVIAVAVMATILATGSSDKISVVAPTETPHTTVVIGSPTPQGPMVTPTLTETPPTPPTAPPPRPTDALRPPSSFADPFDYCTAVGTIAAPDTRYSGPTYPPVIVSGLEAAEGKAPGTLARAGTTITPWRCADGVVLACDLGANLPCGAADVSRDPNQGMRDFCAQNPDASGIPAYLTGHSTIFIWACQAGVAVAVRQAFSVDDQGFVAQFWYRITR